MGKQKGGWMDRLDKDRWGEKDRKMDKWMDRQMRG